MDIPNTTEWKPRQDHEAWLKNAFIEQCLFSEAVIISRLELERKTNLHSFDAGLPLEEVVLSEFVKLFPRRYHITNGIISDNKGQTAGDCDLIIFNDFWFPHVISGTTQQSRKKFLPVDGVYAVGEIKSTLDEQSLYDACKKLVTVSRLNRNWTNSGRVIENRERGCFHGITNPLYTFIFAAGVGTNITFEELINLFFDINKQLKRLEVIRGLCVLGHGVVCWAYHDEELNENRPALFMEKDLYHPIYPVYIPYEKETSAIYPLMTNLHLHLFNSVLAPEDFALHYGSSYYRTRQPKSKDISLKPDEEWIEKLKVDCNSSHH